VNRDALFSHHKATERFLRNVVSLFVSSHYKNSPDDLMLMSDAPKHHVLALIAPVGEEDTGVPEVYAAIQIAMEGGIGSREDIISRTGGSIRPSGDMIPWTLSQQFSDTDFGRLNGIRIVRIAVHPSLARMGYGSEAIRQLSQFVDSIGSTEIPPITTLVSSENDSGVTDGELTTEILKPRKLKKPLLNDLNEPETIGTLLGRSATIGGIDFIGTSFGLTLNLFNFWFKSGFVPLYVRQTKNDTTGEYTCMMLRASDKDWLMSLYVDFSQRFQRLLCGPFRALSSELALSMISCQQPSTQPVSDFDILQILSPYDIKRLRSYARGECDYHLITDLVPVIADLLFNQKISVPVTFLAKRVIVGMGCQRKTIDELYEEDKARITIPQILGIFKPTIDKISAQIEKKFESKIKSQFNQRKNKNLVVLKTVPTPSGPMIIDTNHDAETMSSPDTPSTVPEVSSAPTNKQNKKNKHKGTHQQNHPKKHKI
jgi:N-acetyltransferase 10